MNRTALGLPGRLPVVASSVDETFMMISPEPLRAVDSSGVGYVQKFAVRNRLGS